VPGTITIRVDSRPAGAPALQWRSAFCSAGAPAGDGDL